MLRNHEEDLLIVEFADPTGDAEAGAFEELREAREGHAARRVGIDDEVKEHLGSSMSGRVKYQGAPVRVGGSAPLVSSKSTWGNAWVTSAKSHSAFEGQRESFIQRSQSTRGETTHAQCQRRGSTRGK